MLSVQTKKWSIRGSGIGVYIICDRSTGRTHALPTAGIPEHTIIHGDEAAADRILEHAYKTGAWPTGSCSTCETPT